MNRSKQPMSKQAAKEVRKEVRLSTRAPLSKESKNNRSPDTEVLQERLKKKTAKDRVLLLAAMKKTQIQKTKQHAKHSRRSTPALVDFDESSPSSPHKEGARWVKTLIKQGVSKGKTLTKHLLKKR